RTAPTRPAPMTPTRRRAGAVIAGGSPAARSVLRRAGIDAPLVPVPHGYRTSVAAATVGGRLGGAGGAVLRWRCCSWRGPAATGGVAQVDRRWRVCDRFRHAATSGDCVVGHSPPLTPVRAARPPP